MKESLPASPVLDVTEGSQQLKARHESLKQGDTDYYAQLARHRERLNRARLAARSRDAG